MRQNKLGKITPSVTFEISQLECLNVVDCPPALNLLTMNALTADDEVLIPVTSEFLALQALQDFLATAEEVRRELNEQLKITGILVTQHQAKTGHGRGI